MPKETEPKISVIIPVYNAAKYLRMCLDSVFAQSLQEIEIICVDDGSVDDTCAIVEEYIRRDNRIRLCFQDHAGAGLARNLALGIAIGEYVAFIDGDDFYWDNDALERMYCEAVRQNAVICASYRKVLRVDRITDSELFSEFSCKGNSSVWISFSELQNDWFFQSYIFRRSFLEEHNIFFPPYLRYQDPPFLMKALVQARKFLLIPVCLYCYRQGHKALHLTELQVYHMLSGIHDNLMLSYKHKFNSLFECLIERLDVNYYPQIVNHMSPRIIQKLIAIETLFHMAIPQKPSLRLLTDIRSSVQNLQYERYVFPFYLIKRGMRILLYGASIIGKALYYQFTKYGNDKGEIIGVIDRSKDGSISESLPVFTVDEISDINYDVIVLATMYEDIATDMKKCLLEQGVSEEKIIWDSNGYSKVLFYKNRV